jgi:uncharacterized protein (DUF302 family)
VPIAGLLNVRGVPERAWYEGGNQEVAHASVAEVVARLICRGRSSRDEVLHAIDHSAEARALGLELPETKLVVFGNPRIGTPIMEAAALGGWTCR